MKKTNTNKGLKKLIPAAGMLMLSAAMLGTSTFAWFTMNKEVTITGMEVRTRVGSNLLIQKGALADTTTLTEGNYITDEVQTIQAILEPVSTVDGEQFYYTLDANGSGAKLHSPIGTESGATINYVDYNASGTAAATDTANYANKFSEDYGVTKTNTVFSGTSPDKAVGYVDYVFQLKATNTEGTDQAINLTELKLTYDGNTDGEKAYRVAIFVSDAQNVGGTFANWSSAIHLTPKIYTPSGATNFDSGKAVDSTTTRDTVTYVTTATPLVSAVPHDSVKYYKVCVRLWIEGEDTTCYTNMFKPLTDSWKLDLKMELGQGTGVSNITMATT